MSPSRTPPSADLDSALDALGADELRAVIRGLTPWVDGRLLGTLESDVLERATRAGWRTSSQGADLVAEVEALLEDGLRHGQADPAKADKLLREANLAFLAGDYALARSIYALLLPPLGNGDLLLGQQELVDEVLSVSTHQCVARLLVAVYLTTPEDGRAQALLDAVKEFASLTYLGRPIEEMERVALAPLPGLAEFCSGWAALLETDEAKEQLDERALGDCLREAVHRSEGAEGLARLARASRDPAALSAWCQALVKEANWAGALSAFEEAAGLVDSDWSRGFFLDGAALAALRLGRQDYPERLEAAWRRVPTLPRLLRWLEAVAPDAQTLEAKAASALADCTAESPRLFGFLRLLSGYVRGASELLAASPGLGWTNEEHPGHLLFPALAWALGGAPGGAVTRELIADLERRPGWGGHFIFSGHELHYEQERKDELSTPSVMEVLGRSGLPGRLNANERALALESLRVAAETRVRAAVDGTRRRAYPHAAALVASYVELAEAAGVRDEGRRWAAALAAETRRWPAFHEQLRKKGLKG